MFRVDASTRIGTGHVMRCLALSDVLRARGVETSLMCRSQEGDLVEWLRGRGMAVRTLRHGGSAPDEAMEGEYAAWLGVPMAVDAHETIAALRGQRPDWLVVDHYGLDAGWERELRAHVGRTLVISDLADPVHDCDVLLNQNCLNRGVEQYLGRVPERCRLLLGPRHALLRPEFAAHRVAEPRHDGRVRRVFVFFGGTDPGNVTGRALDVLAQPGFSALEVDVVVGANNPHAESLAKAVTARPHTSLHRHVTDMAMLMGGADLAIGAGGTTTLERMCLGLPSIVVSIAANQVPACKTLAECGLVHYVGADSDVDASDIEGALAKCIAAPGLLADMALRSQAAVDGLGARRVAEILVPTPAESLRLRPAQPADAMLYFGWVNDPEVRRQSLRPKPIGWQEHKQWFARKLAMDDSRLFVMLAGELPVGQVRFDLEREESVIDFAIDPAFRGRGWGRRLLELGLREMSRAGAAAFRADVKEANAASAAVFRRLGFSESRPDAGCGIRVFRRSA